MVDHAGLEPVIEPMLPIIDAHHHLWFMPESAQEKLEADTSVFARGVAPTCRKHARYLFDEFMADIASGHNVRASVFVETHAMYRSCGPEPMRSVGEVEFANGVAAMAESGCFGNTRACAAIVGGVDLTLGDRVDSVLTAHIQAGGGRYRGVRCHSLHDEDPRILGQAAAPAHLLLDSAFRAGFKRLSSFGLSFDACLLEPQLPELIDLARVVPETSIILNHVGLPVGVAQYAGRRAERFPIWREHMRALSACTNVTVKLGGLGTPFGGFQIGLTASSPRSEQLADLWRPYIETCVELFGAERCMFGSNFPVDAAAGTYSVVWNAFKRIASSASDCEKAALFSGTAERVYRLDF